MAVNNEESREDEEDHCPKCNPDNQHLPKTQWIYCEGCKQWYHYDCVNLKEQEAGDIAVYFCHGCEPKYGASTLRRKSRRKRESVDYLALDNWEPVATAKRHPYCDLVENRLDFNDDYITCIKGSELTKQWAELGGWDRPVKILAEDYESLGFQLPRDLTVRKVAELVGQDSPVEVMDVATQGSSRGWTLETWRDYYETPNEQRDRIRNVISLEISQSRLGECVKRPQFVRDMDWVDQVWPVSGSEASLRPKVSLYCLMSVMGSFTDFHIDFGGSSVFYHVIRGTKTFLFIPPSLANLNKYEKWCCSSNQNSTFFGDLVKACYRVRLKAGDSLLIPSGWIHAVHSPDDALVIGGNFLTPINIPMQLRIAQLEERTQVPRKFRFPHFNHVLWYAARQINIEKLNAIGIQDMKALRDKLSEDLIALKQSSGNPLIKIPKSMRNNAQEVLDKLSVRLDLATTKYYDETPIYNYNLANKLEVHDMKHPPNKRLKQVPRQFSISDLGSKDELVISYDNYLTKVIKSDSNSKQN